ncbi:Pycsar system effector family protein [Streptomyces clavuligerus]|uniref:Pycsar effector protein domain-containing protein n=1 Tax=Streptomyces clavuligerus TaxID=1901 RepID=B5GRV1_STRCL|nr:Pycsar system effector family protein [Streptomyces clavuligerus]EDY49047.1 hypothetical protein SSCG_02075 [Streptomyces clavuligerus]EFG03747.1 Hypothetical protein SCLAV_p0256 [Streptomyces clavuligerus]MBY6307715.1 hypothetical protein [Streptomyces clavuligerus]QCS09735.1 hypothetical protein CRV15_29385 [Streptomyces clavuligerus]QPJ98219.1 hypothetical protein GE265_35005 [Streptomyces clavuligerus]
MVVSLSLVLLLTVVLATVPGRDLPSHSALLIGTGALGLAAAVVVVLLVVRPSLSGAPHGTFLHWATCTPQEVAADLATTGTGTGPQTSSASPA